MARPPGVRNADHDTTRAALARAAAGALLDGEGQPRSLNGLAAAVGVAVPTLKHYFGDHDGVVAAALAQARADGEVHLAALRHPGALPLAESVAAHCAAVAAGWQVGVGALFTAGLSLGLGHAARGPAAIDHLLEPTLVALEARLAVHAARGELRPGADLRVAALSLLSPLLLALLHQGPLGGARCRPLELGAFSAAHQAGWLAGWAAREAGGTDR
jgi:AcrR family transcriptional regulator